MTVTGDGGLNGQALAPAPTAAPAIFTASAAHHDDGAHPPPLTSTSSAQHAHAGPQRHQHQLATAASAPVSGGLPPLPLQSQPNHQHHTNLLPAALSVSDASADQLAQLRKSEVKIQHSTSLNYWLVQIRCRDRNKLFFDTVCTLADMNYDIYHATIDSEGEAAYQLFYVRPRYGECVWDERRASKLRYMLESAVQRRFPRGLKVSVQSHDRAALVQLFSALSSGGFWITRADVRTFHASAVFEFTITDTRGQLPEQAQVQRLCEAVGGIMVQDVYGSAGGQANGSGSAQSASRMARGAQGAQAGAPPPAGSFRFSILERRWNKGWGLAGGAAAAAAAGSAGSYDSVLSSC